MPNVGPVGRLGFNVGVAGFRVHTVSLRLVSGGALLFVGLGTPADIGLAFQRNGGLRAGVGRGATLRACGFRSVFMLTRVNRNQHRCCDFPPMLHVAFLTAHQPVRVTSQVKCLARCPEKPSFCFLFQSVRAKAISVGPPLPPNFVLDAIHPLQRDKRRDRRVC